MKRTGYLAMVLAAMLIFTSMPMDAVRGEELPAREVQEQTVLSEEPEEPEEQKEPETAADGEETPADEAGEPADGDEAEAEVPAGEEAAEGEILTLTADTDPEIVGDEEAVLARWEEVLELLGDPEDPDWPEPTLNWYEDYDYEIEGDTLWLIRAKGTKNDYGYYTGNGIEGSRVTGNITIPSIAMIDYKEYKVGLRGFPQYPDIPTNKYKYSIWYPCRKDVTGIRIKGGGLSYPDQKPIKVLSDPDMNRMFSSLSAVTHIDLSGLDTTGVTDMSMMFCDCGKLDGLILDDLNTSQVTDMSWMFAQCGELDNEDLNDRDDALDLSSFDTSKVTNMANMFYLDKEILAINFGVNFNTGAVTDMSSMFEDCESLDPLDVSGFDTSNVTTMEDMFSGCADVNSLNVTGFDTSRVTDMQGMFSGCSELRHLDVTNFDTSQVTSMKEMFQYVPMDSIDLSAFDTSAVTDMSGMFAYSGFNTLDLRNFDTSKVRFFSDMFSCNDDLKTIDLSNFDTGNATSMESMFSRCEGLEYLDLSGFDTSRVTKMGYMFAGTKKLEHLDIRSFDFTALNAASKNGEDYWCNCKHFLSSINWDNCGVKHLYLPVNAMKWTDFSPTGDDPGWYDDKLTDVYYEGSEQEFAALENTWPEDVTFHYNYHDPSPNPYLAEDWYEAYKYSTIEASDFIWLDSSKAGALSGRVVIPATITMGVKTYGVGIRPDCDNPDGGVTLFANNKDSITSVKIEPGVIIGNNADNMFKGMTKLAAVNMDGVKLTNCTSMKEMFAGCTELRMVKFGTLDTTAVTNLSGMFKNCSVLSKINLTTFDTSNVTDMSSMFEDCTVINFDQNTVYRDTEKKTGFYTSKVTTMARMFKGCTKLSNAYQMVERMDLDAVTDMNSMFMDCASLGTASMYGYNSHTAKVKDMSYMFAGCTKLERLKIDDMDFSGVNSVGATALTGFLSDTADHANGTEELVLPAAAMKNTDLTGARKLKVIEYKGTEAQWTALHNTVASSVMIFYPSNADRVGIYRWSNGEYRDVTNGTISMLANDGMSLKGILEVQKGGKYYSYNVNNEEILWTSSNPDVAEVSDYSGWVHTVRAGTAVITATSEETRKMSKVTIVVGNTRVVEIKSIGITGSSHSVAKGKTVQLTAQIEPDDASNKNLDWSSTDTSILTVSSAGLVKGVKAGTASVIARAKDGSDAESAPYEITVTESAGRVRITKNEEDVTGATIAMDPGDPAKNKLTLVAVAEISQTDGTWTAAGLTQDFTWSSSNATIAAVTDTGVVTAKKNGTATITAKTKDGSNKSATVKITVSTLMQSLAVTGLSVVATKKTITLQAVVTPADTSNKAVTWTSDKPAIAKVDTTGRVTGVAAGKATITATAKDGSGKSAAKEITVMAAAEQVTIYRGAPADDDEVTGKTLIFDPDADEADRTVTLYAVPQAKKDGSWSTDGVSQTVTWKSANESIATVTAAETGEATVTVKGAGSTTITATAADGSAKSAKVTVSASRLVQGITLPATASVAAGKVITLTAAVDPDSAKNKTLEWKIAPEDVAKATIANGRVTVKPAAIGTITVTAAAKDGSGVTSNTCVITVMKPAETVKIKAGEEDVTNTTIGLDPDRINTVSLSAVTSAAGATEGVDQTITWKSANDKVATVDANGLVTAVGKGTAAITATAADGTGKSAKVTINVATLVRGIRLSGAEQVAVGKSTQLTATITPDSATNKTLLWSIDKEDAAKATVANGHVTIKAGASGRVHVIAAAKDGSGVNSDDTKRFVIDIKQPVDTVKLFKQADDSEVTKTTLPEQDLTTHPTIGLYAVCFGKKDTDVISGVVTWKSSNEKIATVAADVDDVTKATVTLVAPGTATITATAADGSNKSASVSIKATQSKITITGPAEVAAGKSVKLAATGPAVNWEITGFEPAVADPGKAATITAAGNLTVKSTVESGTVITVTATNKTDKNKKEVYPVTVKKPSSRMVIAGKDGGVLENNAVVGVDRDDLSEINLSVEVYDADESPEQVSQLVTWKSANVRVATVAQDGTVTPLSAGTARITATTTDGMNKSASVTINVASLMTDITIAAAGDATQVAQGKALQFTATAAPFRTANRNVTWYAGNPEYDGVTEEGFDSQTFELPKNAIIISATGRLSVSSKVPVGTIIPVWAYAKDGSEVASNVCDITVTKPALRIDLFVNGEEADNGNIVLAKSLTGKKLGMDRDALGDTVQLKAVAAPVAAPDGLLAEITADTAQAFIWTTSNAKVATVDVDEYGIATVTSRGAGTAQIKATAADGSGKSATVTINVASLVSALTVSGPGTVTTGGKATGTAKYTALVTPDRAADKRVTWSCQVLNPPATPLKAADIRITAGTLTITNKVPVGTNIRIIAASSDGSRVAADRTIRVE